MKADEDEITSTLMDLVTNNMIEDDESSFPKADAVISIKDSGYLTMDKGLVISMEDGTEFMVIVKQTR